MGSTAQYSGLRRQNQGRGYAAGQEAEDATLYRWVRRLASAADSEKQRRREAEGAAWYGEGGTAVGANGRRQARYY